MAATPPRKPPAKPKGGDGFGLIGKAVTYKYRSATGHGTVVGINKPGATRATTEYKVRQHDDHTGPTGSAEPTIRNRFGAGLTVTTAANNAKAVTAEKRKRTKRT